MKRSPLLYYGRRSVGWAGADGRRIVLTGDPVIAGVRSYIVGANTSAEVDDLTFATDTSSTTGGNLSTAMGRVPMLGSPTGTAYALGGTTTGSTNGAVTTCHKLVFVTDSTTVIAGTLAVARCHAQGLSNRTDKGYLCGGAAAAGENDADSVTFATDAVADVSSADLTINENKHGAGYGNATHGYPKVGGTLQPTTIQKLTWSTETTSAIAGTPLNATHDDGICAHNSVSKLYVFGGTNGAQVDTIEHIEATTDTATAIVGTLSAARVAMGGSSQGATAGYVVGGFEAAAVDTCDKIAWATDTVSTPAGAARASGAGVFTECASDVGL